MKFPSRKLVVLETNIDDMNPEWFDPLLERLFQSGVLDASLIPITMKKSRPAVLLQVLVEPKRRDQTLQIIFEETTTLGVRSYPVDRYELQRETRSVKTPYGNVRVKIGKGPDGTIFNVAPEYRSCLEVAKGKKVPLKEIYLAAIRCLPPNKFGG
ncbi:MAG: DUF111 family protein [Deltaproteobacteria bacterium]|nr:DUF111 family protein [Deltaproteobacteria bacterium]MBI4374142.1 DUF111 family protein [Deltaproteobacteria bacterium]